MREAEQRLGKTWQPGYRRTPLSLQSFSAKLNQVLNGADKPEFSMLTAKRSSIRAQTLPSALDKISHKREQRFARTFGSSSETN